MASTYTLVTDLHPSLNQIAVKLRIVRAYDVPCFSRRQRIQSYNGVGHDIKGGRVHIVAEHLNVNKFANVFKEGSVYHIENFLVGPNKLKVRTTTHTYMITLQDASIVREISDDSFPIQNFLFKPLCDFNCLGTIDGTILVDVIGRIASRSPIQSINVKGTMTPMIELTLANLENKEAECTLWGEDAEDVAAYLAAQPDDLVVIIVQFARQKVFQGVAKAENVYNCSKVLINSDIAEIQDFKSKVVADPRSTQLSISEVSGSCSASFEEEIACEKYKFKSLLDLQFSESGLFCVKAEVTTLEFLGKWYYIACKNKSCLKSMVEVDKKNFCERCQTYDREGDVRYKVVVRVRDGTDHTTFILWNREVERLTGQRAADLKYRMVTTTPNYSIPSEFDVIPRKWYIFLVSLRGRQPPYLVSKLSNNRHIVDSYPKVKVEVEVEQLGFNDSKNIECQGDGLLEDMLPSFTDEACTPIADGDSVTPDVKGKRTVNGDESATGPNKKLRPLTIKEDAD